MKKILVDIGSNVGETIRFLKEKSGPFDTIYAFEPNPHHSILYDDFPDVLLSTSAMWTYNGKVKFNIYGGPADMAASGLYKRSNMEAEEIEVECLDFSEWLKNNLDPDDYVILKMDIEGAEFKILEHALNNGGLENVNELYVEHHKSSLSPQRTGGILRDEEWTKWTTHRRLRGVGFDKLFFAQDDIKKLLEIPNIRMGRALGQRVKSGWKRRHHR